MDDGLTPVNGGAGKIVTDAPKEDSLSQPIQPVIAECELDTARLLSGLALGTGLLRRGVAERVV